MEPQPIQLTFGISPCPNDTFIFDALLNGEITTGHVQPKPVLADVQQLNEWALEGKLDVSKISYGVWPLIMDRYQLLAAGGAMGYGVGPLLITRPDTLIDFSRDAFSVALPGEHTTAHRLFSFAYPTVTDKRFLLFSDIESAVLDGRVDAGVIIHENRFTYRQHGLVKVRDLGEYWEQQTGSPIPLGGIVIRRELAHLADSVNHWIQLSLRRSQATYPQLSEYVRDHAQEMQEDVMRQHIELYVNEFSYDRGPAGDEALRRMMQTLHTAR